MAEVLTYFQSVSMRNTKFYGLFSKWITKNFMFSSTTLIGYLILFSSWSWTILVMSSCWVDDALFRGASIILFPWSTTWSFILIVTFPMIILLPHLLALLEMNSFWDVIQLRNWLWFMNDLGSFASLSVNISIYLLITMCTCNDMYA